eukprot:403350739
MNKTKYTLFDTCFKNKNLEQTLHITQETNLLKTKKDQVEKEQFIMLNVIDELNETKEVYDKKYKQLKSQVDQQTQLIAMLNQALRNEEEKKQSTQKVSGDGITRTQDKKHYCDHCKKEGHCKECCYQNRKRDTKQKCEICKKGGHGKNCCPIIWQKAKDNQKKQETRRLKVDGRQSDTSDEEGNINYGEFMEVNAEFYQIKKLTQTTLEEQSFRDREKILSQLCYLVRDKLIAKDSDRYEELISRMISKLDVLDCVDIYEAIHDVQNERSNIRVLFQLVEAPMNQKALLEDCLLASKGIGSFFLDRKTFKYRSLWVSTHEIPHPFLNVRVLSDDEIVNNIQQLLQDYWVFTEGKQSDYYFYLEY